VTEVPDWAINPPPQTGGVHGPFPKINAWDALPQDQINVISGKLTESILQVVVTALRGLFMPGPIGAAFDQLVDWANNLGAQIVDFVNNIAGIDLSSWDAFLDSLKDGKGIDIPSIPEAIETVSEWVETLVDLLLGALGGDLIGGIFDRIMDIADLIGDWLLDTQQVASDLVNLATNLLTAPAAVIGTITQSMVPAITNLVNAIWNGWFGGGGTGNVADVQYTIETIKDAVINGYTVTTFTADATNWAVPENITEFIAVMIGGGNGGNGGTGNEGAGTATPGAGGLHGSFLVQALDVGTLPTHLDIQVGAGGAGGGASSTGGVGGRSQIREANSTPHTGTLLVQSPPPGDAGGVSTTFGYTSTASQPGSGGTGGRGSTSNTIDQGGTAGSPGQSSVLAPGGQGGTAYNNSGDKNGGNVSAGALTKCGGGGGGGGGGGHANSNGNPGGHGGYPGGGGGGGGTGGAFLALPTVGGTGGNGASGVVWIFYR